MSELTTPVMDADEAQKITERIRLTLDTASRSLDRLAALVTDAYQRRADLALGYGSWQEYADAEFAEQTRDLSAPIRRELVGYLSASGMSTRAIAPAVGVSQMQVVRDVKQDVSPAPIDLATVDMTTGEIVEPATHVPAPSPTPVTGLDGKTYTRPAPPPEPTPAAPQVITSREFKPEPKPGTDLHALRYVVIPALNAWADEWTHKTLLDNTVTAEEAAQLLRDLSRTTPVLSQIRRLLNSRTESIK